MTIGIIPNITKKNIFDFVQSFVDKLSVNNINVICSKSLLKSKDKLGDTLRKSTFLGHLELSKNSDIVVSIGGDGTMLTTAYDIKDTSTPIIGLNFGKLGFLAEYDLKSVDELISDLKSGNYFVEERITLEAICKEFNENKMFAINDLVIDKGRWPKMIQLEVKVDDEYVTTFSADGIIIATPTGSTGYSLSVGGPILSPNADAIAISPISPHTLTIRPLVLSSKQKISVKVKSEYKKVQINSDGQRVHNFESPVTVEIFKSDKPLRLVHTNKKSYFEMLRSKLFWGLDVRNNFLNK